MPQDNFLTATQRDERIALLSSQIPKVRCHAALELCHSAHAGTDISSAVPALAIVAAIPHSGDLDAMWAQHALRAAAFHGADLRPALPALLAKLKDRVDQYAIMALRTWASRSTTIAAEVLAAVRKETRRPDREFVEELQYYTKRVMGDDDAGWTTDRPRGVRLRAGRFYWRSSHGWDVEQSVPDYVENGVPRESLKYSTGSWLVPLDVQNRIRSWLGLPPLTETDQDRALAAIRKRLDELAAEKFPTRPGDCALCAGLGPSQGGSPMNGFKMTPDALKLLSVARLPNPDGLSRCPHCGNFYQWKYEHDCEPFVEETDYEQIARVSFEEVRRSAMEAEFGTAQET